MAQIQDSNTVYKPPPAGSGCCPGCFGRSRGVILENYKQGKSMDQTRWFSWSRLMRRKKSPRRTVPVDAAAAATSANDDTNLPKKESFCVSKSGKKFSFSCPLPVKDVDKSQNPAPAGDKIVHVKANKTRYDTTEDIILKSSKSMNHLDSTKSTTYRKGQSSISKSTSKKSTTIGHPNSPEDKREISGATVELSHSVSLPPPTRKKPTTNGGGGSRKGEDGDSQVKEEEKSKRRKDARFDQFIGVSIIMVTLTIMIVWGKLCAILCTSAWFYFYPLLRAKKVPILASKNGTKSAELDINSEEHKKKVVLEGFLERNHRIN